MLPRGALDDAVPDDRWLHEATGNAGASLERAWRRAALVVWPRSRTLAILAGAGIGGAVAWLAERIERDGDGADIARLASEVVGIWPAYRPDRDEASRARMLGLLPAVGDGECLSRFLLDVVVPDYTGVENGELPAAIEAVGPETGTRFLTALVDARFWRKPEELLALLRRLEDEGGASVGPSAGMVRDAVRSVLHAVSEAAPRRPADPETDTEDGEARYGSRLPQQALRDLFVLGLRRDLTDEADAAAGAIASVPRLSDPFRALPAALEEMSDEPGLATTQAFATLWRHAARSLLERSAAPPKAPGHWRMACDVDCGCEVCAGLRAFCADPAARVARFPLRKELRAHLHRTIDSHGLDIDHETERRGRPFTLVCTKNRRSHERRVAEYSDDIGWMRRLTDIAPDDGRNADRAREIAGLRTAVDASARA